jgi:hypothetical protein
MRREIARDLTKADAWNAAFAPASRPRSAFKTHPGQRLPVKEPFTRIPFDFVMQPAIDESEANPKARVARALA